MINYTASVALLLTCFLFCAGALCADDASPLAGNWVNTNPGSDSVPGIEIEFDSEGKPTFFWWGKTHPENSKYGPYDFKLYHKSVGDKQPATSGIATYENHFSKALFTVRMDGGYLKVLKFTEFTDESGRKPYLLNLSFKKE